MGPRIYPLAPATWGECVELPVDNVVQAPLFNDFAGIAGLAREEVLLQPNPLSGAWRVRLLGSSSDEQDNTQGRVIGEIDPFYRGRFTDMQRVDASLLMPKTTATVAWDQASGQFAVRVLLPPPLLAVPRNDAPDNTLTLPAGEMLVVDTSMGEYSGEEIAARSPGQWLVALHHIGGLVAITLGPKVLGAIRGDDARQLISYMDAVEGRAETTQLYARAVLLKGMAALDVAAPSEDNPACLVQQLKVPDNRLAKPWALIEFPDNTWGVSVERDHVADPGDYLRPKHSARYVSLAGIARPDDVDPATEPFPRVQVSPPPPQPHPEFEPEPVLVEEHLPELAPEPLAPPAPEPVPEPEPEFVSESVRKPKSKFASEPFAAPAPEPAPEPMPEPEPEYVSELALRPKSKFASEPFTAPAPEPEPEFVSRLWSEPLAVPTSEPAADPAEPELDEIDWDNIDLDDDSLSEVEKVRLRRKLREREGGGRHRR